MGIYWCTRRRGLEIYHYGVHNKRPAGQRPYGRISQVRTDRKVFYLPDECSYYYQLLRVEMSGLNALAGKAIYGEIQGLADV
jgi:hypothetical protein